MKKTLAFTFLSVITCSAFSTQPMLGYKEMVDETHRIEALEGDEYVIAKSVQFQPVRLNLKSFGKGSDALYVRKTDEIGFVCSPALKNFRAGWVEARVEKHEPGADGGHFFTLSACKAVR